MFYSDFPKRYSSRLFFFDLFCLPLAVKILHVAQPSLSRQMKELEEELGAALFVRGNRKITLTEEGMVLRKRAEWSFIEKGRSHALLIPRVFVSVSSFEGIFSLFSRIIAVS